MLETQPAKDYVVLNADDPRLARAADGFAGTRVLFSRTRAIERGVFVDGDAIISTVRDGFEEVCRVSALQVRGPHNVEKDRKSTRLNSSHGYISYAVFCLKKKK